MAPTPSDHASLLAPWRHDLVTRLIHAFAIIALAALVPGAIAAYRLGKPVILLIDILAYLMLYPAYRLRKRHFTAATVILISSQLAVGGVLMIGVGVEGAALLWLLAPLILANLLLGGRPTIAVLVVAASILAATSVLLHLGRLPWSITIAVWYSILGSFFTVAAIIILSSRFLIDRLVRGLGGEQTLNSELNHRVKNNLQLMGSLIQLHRSQVQAGEAQETLARLSTRVAAMGRTFQLLDRRDGTLRVPVPELIEALIGDAEAAAPRAVRIAHQRIDGPRSLGIDNAIPLAMILTELLTAAVTLPGTDPAGTVLSVGAPRGDAAEFRLTIATGTAAPTQPTPLLADSLSAEIVAALTEQLSAAITESRTPRETTVIITIPLEINSPSAAP
jgi:two-component sensor histidine kinase